MNKDEEWECFCGLVSLIIVPVTIFNKNNNYNSNSGKYFKLLLS